MYTTFVLRKLRQNYSVVIIKISIIFCGIALGSAVYYRTTNIWALKNLADSFLMKKIGRRPIIISAFNRIKAEQNVGGHYVVLQFIGDSRMVHNLFCFSENMNGETIASRAHIQRIHQGKRAANDICSWAGHIAECSVGKALAQSIRLSTMNNIGESLLIAVEAPHIEKHHKLVVCMAPMYTYTDWQTMLLGIEAWLALGATKIIIPIQSATKTVYSMLQEYQAAGITILRYWPKWPILSDVNPNGLVLSRGIEESHVDCLFFVKPWAEMVIFTDMDDILFPVDPLSIHEQNALHILEDLRVHHPQAGSFLFEHMDVNMALPETRNASLLENFSFDFLKNSKWKSSCDIRRKKTRVAVISSRVDTVNMHEAGLHRLGYVQVRVPCHKSHFYHLRHSHETVQRGHFINMTLMAEELNKNMECIVSTGYYEFAHSSRDFIIALRTTNFTESNMNCDSPYPTYTNGSYFYLP